jgi:hypothetical protein
MQFNPRLTSAALVVSIFAIPALWAENLNVSPIAISGRSINWTEEAGALKIIGAATFTYSQVGHARIQQEPNDYFVVAPWSAAWLNSPSHPVLSRQANTPAPTSSLTWASPYYSLAKIDMAATPTVVSSRNFTTGWARSVMNYSVHVEHNSSTPLDYFVLLDNPKYLLGVSPGYTLQPGGPGGGGGTYLYKSPNAARARAAVDVLVDGLPVWSSESNYMYPEGTADYPWDKLLSTWGNTVTENGQTKLYLGKMSAGKAITVTFVVRSDTFVDGDGCGTAYGGWNTPDEKRCFDLTQTVQLPHVSNSSPVGISLYAKNLNTTPILIGYPILWSLFD